MNNHSDSEVVPSCTRFVLAAPFGKLGIALNRGLIARIEFLDDCCPVQSPSDVLGEKVASEFKAYFDDAQWRFSLPIIIPPVSLHLRRVLQALQNIQSGYVKTYGQLARELHSGARAVGNACRANPFPIIIPCHRVVSSSGLGGFSGRTDGTKVDIKRWLLEHEGIVVP